jgi:hypothetical protein
MIATTLAARLRAVGFEVRTLDDPAIARVLERRAELTPADPTLRELTLHLHAWTSADHGLQPVTGGVLRERLVRCDAWTTTWLGTDTVTGGRAMVRVLRPAAARDPALRRALARDGRAVAAVVAGLRQEPDGATLAAVLPGPTPMPPAAGGQVSEEALLRLVARTVGHLAAWHEAGLGLPDLAPEEVCDAGDHLAVVVLTPAPPGDIGPVLRGLAGHLRAWWDDAPAHPLAELLEAFDALPPRTAPEAAHATLAVMASLLADLRHGVLRRARDLTHADERHRLSALLDRLTAAVPAPIGRAAVGVDLEGHTLVVHHLGGDLLLGRHGEEPAVLWSAEGGLDVQATRRLLRVRGSAPVSDRLNREVGGDPAFVDRIAAWLGGQLQLRTLRALL